MKLIGTKIGSADEVPTSLRLVPEDQEDLWALTYVLSAGDVIVVSHTIPTDAAATASKLLNGWISKVAPAQTKLFGSLLSILNSNAPRFLSRLFQKQVEEKIRINSVIYYGLGSRATLRVRENRPEPRTLEISLNREFELRKKPWNPIPLHCLLECCERASSADVAVVVLLPSAGHVHLVGAHVDMLCDTVENDGAGEGLFLESVFHALQKRVASEEVKCVVIGGADPLMKDEFRRILEARSKIGIGIAVASTAKSGMREVLNDVVVLEAIGETNAAREIKALRRLEEMNSRLVCYGWTEVVRAGLENAIETLFITYIWHMYRDEDRETNKYKEVVDSVKKSGGNFVVLSAMHVSEGRPRGFSDFAAILRFPVPSHGFPFRG